jgi:hypothetical protein
VYRRAFAAFDYYRGRYGLQDTEVMIGASPADTSSYKADLRKLSEKGRFWLLFSHVKGATSGLNHESLLLRDLEGLGSQLDSYKKRGASLYLYSFGDPHSETQTSKHELESSDRELPRPPG